MSQKPEMLLTLKEFKEAAGLGDALAQRWHEPFTLAMQEFRGTTRIRLAAAIAQMGHESMGFSRTREIWGPTPAQLRYEGRADLGNVMAGDGSRFRGRGLLQVTGRANYQAVAAALGVDVVAHPALLEETALAARASAWWWNANGCNEIADTGDMHKLTRRINGGYNGLDDRLARYERAKKALGLA